jgi:hypothetical protein
MKVSQACTFERYRRMPLPLLSTVMKTFITDSIHSVWESHSNSCGTLR